MNQSMIRKMSDRKHPVFAIQPGTVPIDVMVQVGQACRAVGWSQAETNETMSVFVFNGLDAFISSLSVCIE